MEHAITASDHLQISHGKTKHSYQESEGSKKVEHKEANICVAIFSVIRPPADSSIAMSQTDWQGASESNLNSGKDQKDIQVKNPSIQGGQQVKCHGHQ